MMNLFNCYHVLVKEKILIVYILTARQLLAGSITHSSFKLPETIGNWWTQRRNTLYNLECVCFLIGSIFVFSFNQFPNKNAAVQIVKF